MFDLDKISQDIDFLVKKHGSWRAAVKAIGINKASLENYYAKITKEPREKNIQKLALAAKKDISYYYKKGLSVESGELQKDKDLKDKYITTLEKLLNDRENEINILKEEIQRFKAPPAGANASMASSGKKGT